MFFSYVRYQYLLHSKIRGATMGHGLAPSPRKYEDIRTNRENQTTVREGQRSRVFQGWIHKLRPPRPRAFEAHVPSATWKIKNGTWPERTLPIYFTRLWSCLAKTWWLFLSWLHHLTSFLALCSASAPPAVALNCQFVCPPWKGKGPKLRYSLSSFFADQLPWCFRLSIVFQSGVLQKFLPIDKSLCFEFANWSSHTQRESLRMCVLHVFCLCP